jgi:two-component system nitrogen regulation response regulator GlnG
LIESLVFGHQRGAFTGAVQRMRGQLELAANGTLLLDEIAEMPIELQAKLLRVLEDRKFRPLGSEEELPLKARVLAATHVDLERRISEGTFREDLFYRLNVVRIQLPPLRQRTEDIRILAEYFLRKVAVQKALPQLKLSEDAVRVLEQWSWPGNVRELENTIHRAVVLSTSEVLLPKDLPLGAPSPAAAPGRIIPPSEPAEITVDTAIEVLLRAAQADPNVQLLPWLEREFTMHALKLTQGNQVRASKLLGITRATLRKRIEQFGITKELTIT